MGGVLKKVVKTQLSKQPQSNPQGTQTSTTARQRYRGIKSGVKATINQGNAVRKDRQTLG